SSADSASSRSSRASAASAATRAPGKKCAYRPAGPSGSSQVKISRTSASADPLEASTLSSLEPARDDSDLPAAPMAWQPRPKVQDPGWPHVLLFLLTVASTTFMGANYYLSFTAGFSGSIPSISATSLLLHGFWYSGTVLAILGCHEMGHYLARRYYDVDASRPYFLPLPIVSPFGTLGAFIRIREPIPQKRILFDIGIAGPIAGFLVA